jgi:hypothetical protein
LSLGALVDAPGRLSYELKHELQEESQDSLNMMFGDDDKKSQVMAKRAAREFYASKKSLSDYYGENLGVKDLIGKFDDVEKYKRTGIFGNSKLLQRESDAIYGKIKTEDDLKEYVRNENMRKYSSIIRDGKGSISFKDEN